MEISAEDVLALREQVRFIASSVEDLLPADHQKVSSLKGQVASLELLLDVIEKRTAPTQSAR